MTPDWTLVDVDDAIEIFELVLWRQRAEGLLVGDELVEDWLERAA